MLREGFDTNDETLKLIFMFRETLWQLLFRLALMDDRKSKKRLLQLLEPVPKKKPIVREQGTGALEADLRCLKGLMASPSDDAVFDAATSARKDNPELHGEIASFVLHPGGGLHLPQMLSDRHVPQQKHPRHLQ